jgi:hypothetical protein
MHAAVRSDPLQLAAAAASWQQQLQQQLQQQRQNTRAAQWNTGLKM